MRSWGTCLLVEVGLHQLVVVLRTGLDQVRPVLVRLLGELLGNLPPLDLGAQLVGPVQRLVLDQIDDARELVLLPDWELDRERVSAEPIAHRLHGREEIRTRPVHLVHVRDPRDAVLVGLPPHRLGLRLDPGHRVEDRDRAVEDPQRALHLDREVDVPWGVEDVDPVALPLGGGRGGGDRDPPLLLLLHPVHDRRALVDLAHLVGTTGVVENALGGRRLTGVDVRHDPDVPGLL